MAIIERMIAPTPTTLTFSLTKPKVGMFVQYASPFSGGVRQLAAIVTATNDTACSLYVFPPDERPYPIKIVQYDKNGGPDAWHYVYDLGGFD